MLDPGPDSMNPDAQHGYSQSADSLSCLKTTSLWATPMTSDSCWSACRKTSSPLVRGGGWAAVGEGGALVRGGWAAVGEEGGALYQPPHNQAAAPPPCGLLAGGVLLLPPPPSPSRRRSWATAISRRAFSSS
jgi:hypothetical protein